MKKLILLFLIAAGSLKAGSTLQNVCSNGNCSEKLQAEKKISLQRMREHMQILLIFCREKKSSKAVSEKNQQLQKNSSDNLLSAAKTIAFVLSALAGIMIAYFFGFCNRPMKIEFKNS